MKKKRTSCKKSITYLLPEEVQFHQAVYAVCKDFFVLVLEDRFDTVAFVEVIAEVMQQEMTKLALQVIAHVLETEWQELKIWHDDKDLWRAAFLFRFNEYLVPYMDWYKGELATYNAEIIVTLAHLPTRAEYLCGRERIQSIAITETTSALTRAQESVSGVYNDVMNEVEQWLANS
jgi:hypothetical protein